MRFPVLSLSGPTPNPVTGLLLHIAVERLGVVFPGILSKLLLQVLLGILHSLPDLILHLLVGLVLLVVSPAVLTGCVPPPDSLFPSL